MSNTEGDDRQAGAKNVLDMPIWSLSLSTRARSACKRLGIVTVGDVMARRRADFLALPGCGPRTWTDLREQVSALVANEGTQADKTPAQPGRRPLLGLVCDRRAERAFALLGITTVEEFLATPRHSFLRVPGVGQGTWDLVWEAVRGHQRPPSQSTLGLLPDALLQLQVNRLLLSHELAAELDQLGCRTVGHMLALSRGTWQVGGALGPEAEVEVRERLDCLVRFGLEHSDKEATGEPVDFPSLKGRLLAPLQESDRELLCQLVGLGTAPRTMPEVAVGRDLDMRRLVEMADEVRARLHTRAPSVLRRLRDEFRAELRVFEGVVVGEHLAAGTLGHTMVKATGDRLLPLRLVAFCFPQEFHLHDNCLTAIEPRRFRRFLRRLRQLTAPHRLPVPLSELDSELSQVVDPVPKGMLTWLLTHLCAVTVRIDPEAGEIVTQNTHSVSARLRSILHEEGQPLSLEDLVFHYRDRYRQARKGRLLANMRRDSSFVEIGPEAWSLRCWHEDELSAATEQADQLAQQICKVGGKNNVASMLRDGGASQREVFLVVDCLRRDDRVRSLGRGDFCPATSTRSQVLEELMQDFRRAMGEVPLSRFLDNQPPGRRRLVDSLLHENRLFVQPSPDRIDVLTNYPFNEERMAQLLKLSREYLDKAGGYSTLSALRAVVNETDLGGGWLGDHLLGDLLRRQGSFEMLPGGILAEPELELGGWIQARARDALRCASMPMTVDEILVEEPELAEFSDCMRELLRQDPMVQTADGQRYQVV